MHEIRAALAEHGSCVARNSLSRFFERHGTAQNKLRPRGRAGREN
jgi:hypothetical protein